MYKHILTKDQQKELCSIYNGSDIGAFDYMYHILKDNKNQKMLELLDRVRKLNVETTLGWGTEPYTTDECEEYLNGKWKLLNYFGIHYDLGDAFIFDFNWDGFTKEKYNDVKNNIDKYEDEYIGCVRVGELCIDVLIRNYYEDDKDKYAFSFDVYVANEDTGYGYRNGIHYDYAEGEDIDDLNLSYEDFVSCSENVLSDFLERNNRIGHTYSLIEKANKPLFIW